MKLTQSQINYRKAKLKKELLEEDNTCRCCKSTFNLELSHLIPVGREKKYELLKENVTIHCHDCHEVWEHARTKGNPWKFRYLRLGPHFLELIHRIKNIDEQYYNRLLIKIPDWLVCIIENYN